MNLLAPAERLAERASPAGLAAALAATLALLLLAALIHAPIEAALRGAACEGLACLKPLRPDARLGGYDAAEFHAYIAATGDLHGRALVGLLADLPLIACLACTLMLAAGLAWRGLPLSERTRRLLVAMPLGYAAADLAENALLAVTYTGMAEVSTLLPWVSALKFGTAMASGVVSIVLAMARAVR